MNTFETVKLGKQYRNKWALEEVTLAIPAGRVVALVGPNGSGKTTLLHCAVGLVTPTTGSVTVLGGLRAGSLEALARVSFVAQDTPLNDYLTVGQMIEFTDALNDEFDGGLVTSRLATLGIELSHRVGKLSGGQQAQFALALAMARHPDLLILDEPLARLDPLARYDFMSFVMEAVAEQGLSVIFSSHVVAELERVADFLVVINEGHVQLAGDIDEVLASHASWGGPTDDVGRISKTYAVIQSEVAGRRSQLLVLAEAHEVTPEGWERTTVSLEELVLAYLRSPASRMVAKPFALTNGAANGATRP
jgi:ABC-2 type transport system ATP-binding protein